MNGLTKDYVALVVEENIHMARMFRSILQQCGLKSVIVAVGESEAVKMLRRSKVDVVLCDWSGETSQGLNVLRKIRDPKGPFNPKLPIIMVASDASVAKVTLARDAGATEFITKPVSMKTLMNVLCSALEKPREFVKAKQYFGPDRRRRALDVKNPRRRADQDAEAG